MVCASGWVPQYGLLLLVTGAGGIDEGVIDSVRGEGGEVEVLGPGGGFSVNHMTGMQLCMESR